MTKAELTSKIKASLGESATNKCAEAALTAVLDAIKEGVTKSGKVQIIGFGTFAKKTRAARKGRNPKTNAVMNIPAKTMVSFKASSKFLG